MARPRFSDILVQRRHELGLTIQQASGVLKLKEQVLVAFEEGDWDNMPQSGYASGMLASYARYLGLNPREVVDVYQEELYEHIHGTSSHELRRRTRDTQSGRGISGYDVVNEAGSRPKAYVEYHTLLPSSGGPAGDMGAFATTSSARARGTGANVPLAGQRREASSSYPATSHSAYVSGHPYNTGRAQVARDDARTSRSGSVQRRRRRDNDPSYRLLSTAQSIPDGEGRSNLNRTQRLRSGEVTTRGVRPSEYKDDMRYDDVAHPYERASTVSGRRSSRNIASTDRPNVRRRPVQDGRNKNARRRRRGGVAGAFEDFFADSRRAILVIVLALVVVLTVILTTSVSSCVRSATPEEGSQAQRTVAVTGAGEESSSDQPSKAEDSTKATDATQDDAKPTATSEETDTATTAEETPKETKVAVTVASGDVTWLEILCDGESKVADNITGPWNQTYTVTDSITIQAAKPDVVSVTNNGEKVSFDSKTGGVATISIKGTPLPEDDEKATKDGEDSAGTSSTGASGTTSSSSTSTKSTTSTGA